MEFPIIATMVNSKEVKMVLLFWLQKPNGFFNSETKRGPSDAHKSMR